MNAKLALVTDIGTYRLHNEFFDELFWNGFISDQILPSMTEDLELSSYLVSLRAHRADSLIPQTNCVYNYLKIKDDSIETYDKKMQLHYSITMFSRRHNTAEV